MDQNLVKPESKKWAASFFAIWGGQAVSLLGSQLVQFALIWWLTRTTGSATVLATATLVGLLPQVFLMPFAGALVDRWNRRVTMMVADSLIALATLVLTLLFWSGQVQVWHVYLMMFIRSAAGGFHWPAMQASTSLMVPKEHLARVQGLNQMLNGGLNIVSAPLGALLLEWLPVQGVLLIDVGTALLAVLPLFLISVPQPVRSQAAEFTAGKTSVWQDFREGWRYAWGWPGLVMIGLMATLINMLLTPAFSLLPILVIRHFNGQAYHLAWMESIQAVGVIAGGLFLGLWGGFRRRVLTSLVGLVFIGIGSMLTGFTPAGAFTLAVVAMFIVGFSLPIANGPLFAAVQAAVAPEMQGRVFTLIGSVSSAMSPLGLLAAGPIADKLGVQTWFILGGIVTILMGVTSLFVPAILNFEESRSADHKAESVQQPLPAEAVQGD